MQGKPGARGGASNHHSPATGQMEAGTKRANQSCSVSVVSVEIKKQPVIEQKLRNKQSTQTLYSNKSAFALLCKCKFT